MKPKELINGLKDLAEAYPRTAHVFYVPTVPAADPRLIVSVTGRDLLDLCDYIEELKGRETWPYARAD